MSLSNPTETTSSPVRLYLQWLGAFDPDDKEKGGHLKYYDKDAKREINLENPYEFIVLDDRRFSVTGYNEPEGLVYFSTEATSIDDTITIFTRSKTTKVEVESGTWDELKGGKYYKYTKHIYIASFEGNELFINMIRANGSFFGKYIDFTKKNDKHKNMFHITGKVREKKGQTNFYAPVFSCSPIPDDLLAQAIELDKKLQEYFKKRGGKKKFEENMEKHPDDEQPPEESSEESLSDDDIPF